MCSPGSQHGIAGCICQFALTLQPKWREVSTNPAVRCENGDPFQMMLAQIDSLVIEWIEGGVNWFIDRANDIVNGFPLIGGAIGRPFPRFCYPGHPHDPAHACSEADQTAEERAAWLRCEHADLAGGLDLLCYYKRVCPRTPAAHPDQPSNPTTACTLPGVPNLLF